jgi:hypothetical protein
MEKLYGTSYSWNFMSVGQEYLMLMFTGLDWISNIWHSTGKNDC